MSGKQRRALITTSTKKWLQEARKPPRTALGALLHGYIYARWPYLYIGMGTGEHPLAKKYRELRSVTSRLLQASKNSEGLFGTARRDRLTFAEGYHGKVMPLDAVSQLVLVGEEIKLPDLEQVIPYQRARALILQNPEHIAVLECPCRMSRSDPCLPLDVCLIVGEPFAGFVIEHHPQRARWITQEQAVEILRQEDARGHVHHAFFKDAMFGRFYAICNCCACCCGAMQFHRQGTPMLAASGYLCQVDAGLCLGCGECNTYCQFGALSLVGTLTTVDEQACMGCGVCVDKCSQGALSLERALEKGIPLEIDRLMVEAAGRDVELRNGREG